MTIFLLQLLCIGSIAYLFHLASLAFPHYYFYMVLQMANNGKMTGKQKKTSIIFGQIKDFFVNLQKYQKTILIKY